MIVIDASSLVKFLLKEERWDEVEPYLRGSPVSVDHVLIESANAIWKQLAVKRHGAKSSAAQAFQNLKKVVEHVLVVEPLAQYLDEAFAIAVRERISTYDAIYIAEAKRHEGLLTSDSTQKEAAIRAGIDVSYVP